MMGNKLWNVNNELAVDSIWGRDDLNSQCEITGEIVPHHSVPLSYKIIWKRALSPILDRYRKQG